MSNPEVLRSIDQAQMEFHQTTMRELERRRVQQQLEERVIWGPEPERRSRGPFLLDELGMMPSPRPDHNRPVPTSLIDEMRPYQYEQNISRELLEYKAPKPADQLISDEDLTFFGFEKHQDPYLGSVYKSQLTYLKEEIISISWINEQHHTEVVEKERFVYYVQNNRLYDYKNPGRKGYIKDIYEFIEFINDRGDFEGKAEKQLNRNKGIYSQLGNSERVNYNRGDFNLGTLRDSFGSLFGQPRNDRRVRIQTGAEGMQTFNDALRDQAIATLLPGQIGYFNSDSSIAQGSING